MYDGEKLKSTSLKVDLPDYEETLEDAEESRLKMKDNMIQLDYVNLNALYDSFVPQKEIRVKQTYFSSPSTSNVSSESSSEKSNLPFKKIDRTVFYDDQDELRQFYKKELHTNSKSTSTNVTKFSSSSSLVSNKLDTLNLIVCQSNASVLKPKTVNAVNGGSNLVCVSCGKDVFMISHDKCVSRYAFSADSMVIRALFTSPVATKSRNLGATFVVAKSRFSVGKTLTEIKKFSRASSLTPKSSQSRTLVNYMKNKIATSRKWQKWFKNQPNFNWSPKRKTEQSTPSVSKSSDSVRTNSNTPVTTQKWVAKLSTLPFVCISCDAVRQFCDGDLKVAFCSSTCYVWNLKGEDLLTGSRNSNLCIVSISEMAASSLVCLMSKVTSTKLWLWHQRLSHLNFDTGNHLMKQDLIDGLPKFKYDKDHLCSACEQGKSKKATLPPKLVPSTKYKLEFIHMLVPSCFMIFDLEPLALSCNFVFTSEIFKSLSFSLDRFCHIAILCLDQHAHTLHRL
nr:retrovirus-related Pol polyprotein from transposon TNT 1-94 [Tanacetum cinerariifolium]